MKKVLLINTSSEDLYKKAKVNVAMSYLIPPLTLVTLAAPLVQKGHEVKICDLNLSKEPKQELDRVLHSFNPDYAGISFMTASFNQMIMVTEEIKKFNKSIIVIGGGPHASNDPIETLVQSKLDIAVMGEGDFTLVEIVSGKSLDSVEGIAYKNHLTNKIKINKKRKLIDNLDDLPMPAWNLINIKDYKLSPLIRRKLPVGAMESSRGCPFACIYCSKSVCGQGFRAKSWERVLKETEQMLNLGFKEIQVVDDLFSADMSRAKKICDEIKKRKLDFVWNLRSGIRIDRVDEELVKKLVDSGCYRTSFGLESGNQEILNSINKGITLDQVRGVFKYIKNYNIETLGFFMIALPKDTEKTMQNTIDFALEIDPTIAKATITTPFPGTSLFDYYDNLGRIKSRDWSQYFSHDPSKVYDHPTLKWETIFEYYNKFYKSFYFRPKFAIRRLAYGIRNKTLIYDAKSFLSTKW